MRRLTALALIALAAAALAPAALAARAEGSRVNSVDTTFKVLGRNDRIVVDRYDDPKVDGVSCYLSRAETGGVKGSLGLATDPSRFSIACRATGKVVPKGNLPDNEVVFGESASLFFKEIRVSRIVDKDKRVLVYLVWSTISIGKEGSPYNSVSAVAMDPP